MDDDLERLFAADEAAIADEGFTRRVMDKTDGSPGLRRVAIYGAGMAGFGVAAGSFPALMSVFPLVGTWASAAVGVVPSVRDFNLDVVVTEGSQAMTVVLAALAVAAFSLAAGVMQER